MFIVRSASGTSITYNDAHFLKYTAHAWELYTADPDKKGKWIVSIPTNSGWIVEAIPACKVENPVAKLTGENALKYVAEYIRTFHGYDVGKLKAALRDYDLRRGVWRSK